MPEFVLRPIFLLTLVSAWNLFTPFLDGASRQGKRGMEDYRNQDWVGAAERFGEASRHAPDPRLEYNRGAALYRGQNYDSAEEAFRTTRESSALPPGTADLALGNARFRKQDLAGALEAYRDALRADPGLEDARYNYELVRRMMETQPPQQPEPQEDQENEEEGEGDSSSQPQPGSPPDSSAGDSRKQSEPEQGEQEQGERPEEDKRKPQGEPGEQPSSPEERPPEGQEQPAAARETGKLLTPEEARKLLDQITPGERDLIEQRLQTSRRRKAEKDW